MCTSFPDFFETILRVYLQKKKNRKEIETKKQKTNNYFSQFLLISLSTRYLKEQNII